MAREDPSPVPERDSLIGMGGTPSVDAPIYAVGTKNRRRPIAILVPSPRLWRGFLVLLPGKFMAGEDRHYIATDAPHGR